MTDPTPIPAAPDLILQILTELKAITPQALAVVQEFFPNDPALTAAINAFGPIIQYLESGSSSTSGIASVCSLILQDEPTVMSVLQSILPGNPLLAEVVAIFPIAKPMLQLLAGAKAASATA